MTQEIVTTIIDAEDDDKIVNVEESTEEPDVYGIVILNPDWSTI